MGNLASGVVVAAIPGLKECHVVARLRFNGPGVIIFLGLAKNKPERSAEAINCKGSHFDAFKCDFPKLL